NGRNGTTRQSEHGSSFPTEMDVRAIHNDSTLPVGTHCHRLVTTATAFGRRGGWWFLWRCGRGVPGKFRPSVRFGNLHKLPPFFSTPPVSPADVHQAGLHATFGAERPATKFGGMACVERCWSRGCSGCWERRLYSPRKPWP